jgi:hypothetical protein
MDLDEFRGTMAGSAPPEGMSLALQTLWWDAKGDWDRAHGCAQQDSGQTGSAVHAYLHRKEGDMRNAGGWYSRAGRAPAVVSLDDEWQALVAEMLAIEAVQGARAALEGFMAALNARDADAMRTRWLHFPCVCFARRGVTMIPTPADYDDRVWTEDGKSADWGRVEWDAIEAVDAGPDKVHFRAQFTCYRTDGSTTDRSRALYIVIRRNRRWAIQGRSSLAA